MRKPATLDCCFADGAVGKVLQREVTTTRKKSIVGFQLGEMYKDQLEQLKNPQLRGDPCVRSE